MPPLPCFFGIPAVFSGSSRSAWSWNEGSVGRPNCSQMRNSPSTFLLFLFALLLRLYFGQYKFVSMFREFFRRLVDTWELNGYRIEVYFVLRICKKFVFLLSQFQFEVIVILSNSISNLQNLAYPRRVRHQVWPTPFPNLRRSSAASLEQWQPPFYEFLLE